MALTSDLLFKDGVDWIDVKKKLKCDFSKAGDLQSINNLEDELRKIASKLFAFLSLVMQDKMLSGANGCRCRFNIRLACNTADLEDSVCSEIQDGDKFPVAVTDASSLVCPLATTEVTLDHVRDRDASIGSFKLDSSTEMPIELNLVADDPELLDTTPDMTIQTQRIVQCSESSVSTTIPDDCRVKQPSSAAIQQISTELEAISCQTSREIDEPSVHLYTVEKDISVARLSSTAPEQVADERETTCSLYCTETDESSLPLFTVEKDVSVQQLSGQEQVASELETTCGLYIKEPDDLLLNHVEIDASSHKAAMTEPKKQAEPLQKQLKIAPRNVALADSFRIESVCEVRRSLSLEAQDSYCDAKDKVGDDGYFKQPQPPGIPPAITGFRLIKSVEPKVIQSVANRLGRGGYGSVYKAQDQETGILLAIKKVKFMKEDLDEATKEVHIMDELCHRNIISLLGSQVEGLECQIFLEWMAGGSVQELLNQYGRMSDCVIQSYSEQVLSGVAYLHQRNILHCDIKGANILVDSTGQVAKLCDFGLSMKMPVPKGTKEQGTIPFMAPELFNGGCNSSGSDIWSIGCTMIQMATGEQPWNEFHHYGELCVMMKICTAKLPIPSSLPPLLQRTIAGCLEKDEAKRPTARHLLDRLTMPLLEDTCASPYLNEY